MPGFADLGAALAGNDSGNALAYAKGLSLGANTQNALAEARARVQKSTALDQLGAVMAGFGITDPTQQAAYATAAQAGINPTEILGARKTQQEVGIRDTIAHDPTLDDTHMQRLLSSLANGPVQTFESAGEGMVTNRLHPELGVTETPLGEALAGQRNAAAALDTEKRLRPERFRAGGAAANGKLVDMGGGVKAWFQGLDDFGNPIIVPLSNAKTVGDNVRATTGAKAEGKAAGEAAAGLPDQEADIDKMTSNINGLLAKPGFNEIYGNIQGQFPGTMTVLSQDAADAIAARKQISAESFGVAIQKMRGLGALSNAEGLKVESAFTRATDPTLSEQEARNAWGEVLQWLSLAKQRAQRKAAGDFSGGHQAVGDAAAPAAAAPAAGGAPLGADGQPLW